MIRVGRCIYDKQGKREDPYYAGFQTIVVLTRGTNRWGAIGPYELKDAQGRIMENIWQFSKVYPRVGAVQQRKSRYEDIMVWEHPDETHLIDAEKPATPDNLTAEYHAWRTKGFQAPYAVRYPPGFGNMANCVGALIETKDGSLEGPLDYIAARKRLYLPLYTRLVKRHPLFAELRRLHQQGKNILIAEVDGPHEESLPYYREKYGVGARFIKERTVLATQKNLSLLLNDALHPFGHGYCLAAAIAGLDLLKEPIREKDVPRLGDDELEAALQAYLEE